MQQVDLVTSFTKLNENCGLPDFFTDYQIFLRITRFVILVIRSDYQKFCLISHLVPMGGWVIKANGFCGLLQVHVKIEKRQK